MVSLKYTCNTIEHFAIFDNGYDCDLFISILEKDSIDDKTFTYKVIS
jgi:hypothetical protein